MGVRSRYGADLGGRTDPNPNALDGGLPPMPADATLLGTHIAPRTLDLSIFEGSFTGIEIVAALPTLPSTSYPEGHVVYLTTDDKLYRSTGPTWTAAVPAVDISGQITTTQITDLAISTPKLAANAVTAAKIAALTITANEIAADAITTNKILAGNVTAAKISVSTLSAIVADIGIITAGRLDNATSSPTAGIRLTSGYSKPGTWTRYVDFAATSTNPVFKHELLSLNADGTATFNGFVDITAVGLQTFGTFAKHAIRVHDTGVAHGITDILPTDAFGLIGGDPTTADGGFIITGIAVSTGIEALGLYGLQVTGSTTKAAVAIVGAKKSGTTFGALASTEKVFGVWNNNTELIKIFGDGATTFAGLLTVVGEKNAQVKWSTSDPSGTPPDGTIWVKY